MSEFTDEQILNALHQALQDREFEAAASLLCLLATQAPDTADFIRAAIEAKA